MTTLRDLGERRIVREVLSRRYSRTEYFGNDSAYITSNVVADEIVVASTDPCPRPIAFELGFSDPYYFGWLLAAINFSDLAAAGARPIALLSPLILPAESPVSELERLLDGLDACATLVGATVAGGNL